ncbi:MAG: CobW family GTP-binding protein [Anaerolineae bacterium]
MNLPNKEKVSMAILTGYLGAGKTTLLNRVLNADHKMRIAVLVNDFGAINIDAKLIVGMEGETITLSNGCICCTIRGDMVMAIADLLKRDPLPDYIIVEASGVSDPAQVVLTFNRSFLRSHVQIDSIVAVVDGEQFDSFQENTQRLLREQVRVSDIIILNKTDLIDDTTRQKAHQWIEGIIDKARIIETQYCDVPIETIIGSATYNPQTAFDTSGPGVHAHNVDELHDHEHGDHSLVFATWAWESDDPLVLSALRRVLDDLPSTIFRAKGVIYSREFPDLQVVLQLVGNRVALTEGEPWNEQTPKTSIVVIGDIDSVDKLTLQQQFDEIRASEVPESEFTQLIDGVLKWLRAKQ